MALVVFLRGVNVGGHKTFRPSALAKELTDFDVVNVGAAGTYVVRKAVSQKVLRAELSRRLPFEAEFMICTARDLTGLEWPDSYPAKSSADEMERFISVLASRPRKLPALPLSRPDDDDTWQVRVVCLTGKFALSLLRRVGQRLIYPNEVVEKSLGVPATTRNWRTVCTICDILNGNE
jgi:uncharacterized protein (DUF1697 family)